VRRMNVTTQEKQFLRNLDAVLGHLSIGMYGVSGLSAYATTTYWIGTASSNMAVALGYSLTIILALAGLVIALIRGEWRPRGFSRSALCMALTTNGW
jgi:apolipoprotein N-acyltransferase